MFMASAAGTLDAMESMRAFDHENEKRWLVVEVRPDGLTWHRIYRLNPDRPVGEPESPDRYLHVGSIAWGPSWQKCEGPDGSPAPEALTHSLLVTLDSARGARVID